MTPKISNTTVSSIDKIKERIIFRKGMARSNRFVVDFSAVKSKLINFASDNAAFDDLNYFCETCSLPGRTTNTMEYGPWHREIKMPIGYVNDDVEMTFLLTNDFFVKKFLDAWANLVIDPKTYLLNYDTTYRADVVIYQIDDRDNITYGVTIKDAFPYSIKAIDLNNGDSDTISKCSASFAYRDFEVINMSTIVSPVIIPKQKPQGFLPAAVNSVVAFVTNQFK